MISSLIEKIKEIDLQVYYIIHEKWTNTFFDKWMPIITNIDNWIWIIVLAWIALFIFGGYKGRLVCILTLVTILIVDNLSSYILKPFFGRIRPNIMLEMINAGDTVQLTGSALSFPSNHAINIFALAMLLSWYYKKLMPIWFLGALIVGYSRVYIGVHYPLDVIGGACAGILCSLLMIFIAEKFSKKYKNMFSKFFLSIIR